MAKFPGLPSLSTVIPREIRSVLEPMMNILRSFTGTDDGNSVVMKRDLVDAGLIQDYSVESITPLPANDFTPPPAPTGLTATGALATVMLQWDYLDYDNLGHAEVWRSSTNDISQAQYIGQSTSTMYQDVIGSGGTRFYWIRYVSKARVPGPFNAQLGVQGVTGTDAGYLLDVLAANPPPGANFNKLLYVQADQIVIDGVTIPAGVYMNSVYVRDMSVVGAKIAKLAVDDSHIANLNAGKITAGYVSADRVQAGSFDAKIANLDAAVIKTGYIDKARIGNATIDLAAINVASITSLSALSANLGSITGGSININSKFIVASDGTVTIKSGLSGARVEIKNDCIKVYDGSGGPLDGLRVIIGNLAG